MGNEILSDEVLSPSAPQAQTHMASHSLTTIRIIVLILIIIYISKQTIREVMIIVNLFFWKGKGTRRRQSSYSFLNNFFGTGDLAKDMQTIKNTIFNSKVIQVPDTTKGKGKIYLFLELI